MKKHIIRLTESDLKKIVMESVNKILKEDLYGLHQDNHIMNTQSEHDDFYDAFVVLDGTQAIVGNFDSYDDAVEYARELAYKNRYGTYEVYGCENGTYSTDEEDSTLVYSSDEEI